MKVVKTGDDYRVYDDNLVVYDNLPPLTYKVRFAQMVGFYLEAHNDMEIKEEKIYGNRQQKVDKVIRRFEKTNRNLGVILSGNKGIGKSLFAKMLARDAVAKNYPLIIVDEYIPGLASFIEEIEQEVVILFDEFDKVFVDRGNDKDVDPQTTLLSLFDGVSSGKKMFVVTCNELRGLNQFLVNRPGRFHYHFRFEMPDLAEIKEYLLDNLEGDAVNEIPSIIEFAKKVPLNYDCLRAIVEELQDGEPFITAIKDLNILNTDTQRYNLVLLFDDGTTMRCNDVQIDLFESEGIEYFWFTDSYGDRPIRVEFSLDKVQSLTQLAYSLVDGDTLKFHYDDEEDYDEGYIKGIKEKKAQHLEIHRKKEKSLHYLA